ncbi:MAG: hypothetical protein PF637_03890 [Spirochaetes bacterium]|jgi:hypothetical protein|nr:hypothetical protein [Spirochaetota bacterium]
MYSKKLFLIGCFLTVLNVLTVINGMIYFFGMAGFSFVEWFFFNICAPSTMIFIAGFTLRKIWLMTAAVPLMLFYGFGGLFIFGWSGTALFSQASHLLMTAAVIFTGVTLWFDRESIRAGLAGLAGGVLLFILIYPFQQSFVTNRMDLVEKLQDPAFEEFIKNQGE